MLSISRRTRKARVHALSWRGNYAPSSHFRRQGPVAQDRNWQFPVPQWQAGPPPESQIPERRTQINRATGNRVTFFRLLLLVARRMPRVAGMAAWSDDLFCRALPAGQVRRPGRGARFHAGRRAAEPAAPGGEGGGPYALAADAGQAPRHAALAGSLVGGCFLRFVHRGMIRAASPASENPDGSQRQSGYAPSHEQRARGG